jgi:hypothetical protein
MLHLIAAMIALADRDFSLRIVVMDCHPASPFRRERIKEGH